ncbi:hypothetical protein GCM10011316_17120 [Roseibium aquae]|uniref:FkbM family methyltransferase n=1 Tax=Roseibium aquae TaxID=1323746 RepID=A0A916TIZ1_9HYPH|nr:hypothetical protein [Roseibium aquae]GGB45626.1 hypothetical protein GCM10011316_17120 [Roseibium aquae]
MRLDKLISSELEYFEPILKRQKEATQEAREAWRKETVAQRLERVSLETYDLCKGTVSQGLFKGLQLNRDAWWGKSDLGAQCLGLYEKEILDFISARAPFDTFLDIGAADGYYAVGLLHAKKTRKAICFEISEEGQRAINENWQRNEKPGELEVHGEATKKNIASVASNLTDKTLVLIDIEGFEFQLLSKKVIAALGKCTVIIEIHNWIDGFENKYPDLLKNLDRFFDIAIISPSERNTQSIELLRSYTDDNRLLVSSERRPCLMRFLHLTPKKDR